MGLCITDGKTSRYGAKALCDHFLQSPWLKPGGMDGIVCIGNNCCGLAKKEELLFLSYFPQIEMIYQKLMQ
jgi:hypothetical protein